MNKLFKILISGITTIVALSGFASVAFAQILPLDVHFQNEPLPLFNEANFLPGNEVIRTVGVSNNSGSTQNIITEAINIVDNGGLGDKLNLVIKEGDVPLYTDTLGQFLRAGEVPLSTLATGSGATYSFNVTFVSDANNDTQNKTLGFDLCIGFSGGDRHCGNTVISDEENTDGSDNNDGGGTISGSGGGGGGTRHLIILNEQAINIYANGIIPESGIATITWETNLLATSQVVYGPASGSYILDLNTLPNFGYPFGTAEDSNKVIIHSMFLAGLTPGQTYKYRVVSRASPPSVSYEHTFTVPGYGNANTGTGGSISFSSINQNYGGDNEPQNRDGLGGIGTTTAITTEGAPSNLSNIASVFLSGIGDLHPLWWILLIFFILIVLFLLRRIWIQGFQ